MIRNKPASRDSQLAIEIPAPEKDKPAWVKVGVIAAVGFVIGIAWPRIAGIRIGPNAPGEAAASASAAHGGRAPDSPPASVAKPATSVSAAPLASAPPPASAPPSLAGPPTITVARGMVLSCKTTDGEKKKGKDCGAVPGVDEIVRPRIRKIANCSGVEGQTGKFTLTANADFVSGRFNWDVPKASASVPNYDAIMSCLKTNFHNTATTATPHEHNQYTVVYTAELKAGEDIAAHHDAKAKDAPPEEKPAPTADTPKATLATGEAEIEWDVGLVRESPKTGALQGRLPRGTKVKVGATKDGWYQIKYGDNFATEGWIYRGAIGR